ncbi:MAG: hypothetical protein Q6368_007115 [Candidatus Baldrarchaeota archaeon]
MVNNFEVNGRVRKIVERTYKKFLEYVKQHVDPNIEKKAKFFILGSYSTEKIPLEEGFSPKEILLKVKNSLLKELGKEEVFPFLMDDIKYFEFKVGEGEDLAVKFYVLSLFSDAVFLIIEAEKKVVVEGRKMLFPERHGPSIEWGMILPLAIASKMSIFIREGVKHSEMYEKTKGVRKLLGIKEYRFKNVEELLKQLITIAKKVVKKKFKNVEKRNKKRKEEEKNCRLL